MAYTHVGRSRNAKACLLYLFSKPHNGHGERNAVVGTVNMLPGYDYAKQFDFYWNRAARRHPNQAILIIQSFSRRELDPENLNDIEMANEIGLRFCREHFSGHQCLVCTQVDGAGGIDPETGERYKTGCVHNHIVISDVNTQTYQALKSYKYKKSNIEKWSDEIIGEYVELDHGREVADILTRAERMLKEKRAAAKKKNYMDRLARSASDETAGKAPEKTEQVYVFRDDVKQRVRKAMESANSEDDFVARLARDHVTVSIRDTKKYGKHYTYELDRSVIPEGSGVKNNKVRSYKLGTDYGPEKLEELLKEKENQVQAEAEVELTLGAAHNEHTEEISYAEPVITGPYEDGYYRDQDGRRMFYVPPVEDEDEEEEPDAEEMEYMRNTIDLLIENGEFVGDHDLIRYGYDLDKVPESARVYHDATYADNKIKSAFGDSAEAVSEETEDVNTEAETEAEVIEESDDAEVIAAGEKTVTMQPEDDGPYVLSDEELDSISETLDIDAVIDEAWSEIWEAEMRAGKKDKTVDEEAAAESAEKTAAVNTEEVAEAIPAAPVADMDDEEDVIEDTEEVAVTESVAREEIPEPDSESETTGTQAESREAAEEEQNGHTEGIDAEDHSEDVPDDGPEDIQEPVPEETPEQKELRTRPFRGQYGGRKFTPEEIEALRRGEEIRIHGFHGRSGRVWDITGRLGHHKDLEGRPAFGFYVTKKRAVEKSIEAIEQTSVQEPEAEKLEGTRNRQESMHDKVRADIKKMGWDKHSSGTSHSDDEDQLG